MNKLTFMVGGLCIFLMSCQSWTGKYISEGRCTTLDYIELFPDKTADLKYYGAPFAVNKKIEKIDSLFYIGDYQFIVKNDTMREISGLEIGCIMLRQEAK